MKTKYFFLNKNGKIEFTKEELDKLLKDTYDEGYSDGSLTHTFAPIQYVPYWYNSPSSSNVEVWCSGSSGTENTITTSAGPTTIKTVPHTGVNGITLSVEDLLNDFGNNI